MDTATKEAQAELAEMIVDALDYYTGDVAELHNEVFNTDYFIIGTYKAKQWLEKNYGVFEAMGKIREYETDNFGEVSTDLSDPERVCNMLVYILGEELMSEVKAIQDNWDEEITPEIAEAIKAELN